MTRPLLVPSIHGSLRPRSLGPPGSLALALIALTASVGSAACVSKERYDKAVAEAQRIASECNRRLGEDQAALAAVRASLASAQAKAEQNDAKLSALTTSSHNLQAELDQSTAINQQLRGELERLGKDVDKLLKERGALAGSLDEAKTRLEELRKAQAAAEQRAALFKDLVAKSQKMVDAGQLKVAVREGRMVLQLPNDVLFDSGKVDLKPAGQGAIKQVAGVLKSISGRRFQVAGHTDNVPIQTHRFSSNWELSTERAVQVVRFMIMHGVPPAALSAAGYGEWDPVAPNTTPDGRAKNRRIEITLQPNLDELVAVPNR